MTYKSSHSGIEFTQFNSTTEEYQKWNALEGEEWQKELDAMAHQGLTLSYDNVEDVFLVEEVIYV